MENLTALLFKLAGADVRLILVGGFGAVSLGSSLVTRDVDVACDMSIDSLVRLQTALAEFHPVHRMTPQRLPFTRDDAQRGDLRNLYLSTDIGQIDILGEIKGIGDFSSCLERSDPLVIDGKEIRVLTIDALIEAKRAMGRPKDLHAVLELEAIRERLNQK